MDYRESANGGRSYRPFRQLSGEGIELLRRMQPMTPLVLRDIEAELQARGGAKPRKEYERRASSDQIASGESGAAGTQTAIPARTSIVGPSAEELEGLRLKSLRADQKVRDLELELALARQRIAALEHQGFTALDQRSSLWARVGLTARCPDFVLRAARAAYRKHFHPDLKRNAEKQESEQRFKEAEQIFAELFSIRRLRL